MRSPKSYSGDLPEAGLHLLTPIRSYIEVGGLVVVPASGSPYYVDRQDAIPASSSENIVGFSAVLAGESQHQAAHFGIVASLMQMLIKVPLSFSFDANQDVEMGQITASGTRLKIPSAQSLVQTGDTNKWVLQEFGNHSKVYVVYEVYRARTLSLRGAGGAQLNMGLAIGANSAAAGGSASPSPKPSGSTSPSASPSTSPSPKPSASPSASPKPGAQPSPSPQGSAAPPPGSAAGAGSAAAACGATPSPAPSSTPAPAEGVSASAFWRRTSASELTLCGTDDYPFAVRVAEVVGDKDGVQLRPGSFQFSGGLGAGTDVEKYTAFINKQRPMLALTRKRVAAPARGRR